VAKSILELQGMEKGNRCILVGGGHSVEDFDFCNIEKGFKFFGVNFQFKRFGFAYILYTDNSFKREIQKGAYRVPETSKLIGHERNLCERSDFYFNFEIIKEGIHSGFYALQVCQKILEFSEVYLVGFDYYTVQGLLHYYDKEKNVKKFNERHLRNASRDFYRINWNNGIYNCNPFSNLKRFPFRLPWAVSDLKLEKPRKRSKTMKISNKGDAIDFYVGKRWVSFGKKETREFLPDFCREIIGKRPDRFEIIKKETNKKED